MAEIRIPSNLNTELLSPKSPREKFIQIGQSVIGESLTPALIQSLYYEYEEFFNQHDLSELKFKIDFDSPNNSITFVPLRNIDKLALVGLLTL